MERKRLRENFTQIPNDLLEAVVNARIGGTDKDFILVILRLTFGWQKEEALISNGLFRKFTGLPNSYVIKRLRLLKSQRVIRRFGTGKNSPHLYSINKNVSEWLVEFRGSDSQVTGYPQDTKLTHLEVTKTTDLEVIQEINKETKESKSSLKDFLKSKNPELWNKLNGGRVGNE